MISSQKIDRKEFICLIANIISLNAILTFPSSMTKLAGTAGWILSLIIILFAFLGVVILHKLYKPFNGKDILEIANLTGGKKLEIIIGILSLSQVFYGGVVVARQFGESLNIIALPNSPVGFVTFLLMLGSGVVACLGLDTIARVTTMFSKIISGGIILILLGVMDKFKIVNLFPILGNQSVLSIKNGIIGMSWFSGILSYFLFMPFLNDKNKSKNVLYSVIGLSGLFMFLVTFVYQGVFSYPVNTKQFLPLYALSRSIKQGGKIERIEAIFLVVWVISALIFISFAVTVMAYLIKRLFGLEYYRPLVLSSIIIIFSSSLMYKNIIGEESTFIYIYRRISYVTSYIMPLVLLIFANIRKNKIKLDKVIVCIICVLFLTGCYDKEEIDNITYVIAMGIDKGEKENIKITMQYFTINEKSDDKAGNEETTSISLETSSILNGINMINNSIDRKLSFSHTKLIVISEELSKDGNLTALLKPIQNLKEFRPNVYIAVSKQEANKYLKAIEKLKKPNIARYYELMFSSYQYSGYYLTTTKEDFYYKMGDEDISAIAPYVAINNQKEKDKKDDEFVAGEIPEKGKETNVQIMGLAVFNNDKMVDFLTGKEVMHYLMSLGEFKRGIYTIEDPLKKDRFINIRLRQSKKPTVEIDIKNEPKIKLGIQLNCDYIYFESDVNYNNKQKNAILVNHIERTIEQNIKKLLYKTSKEMDGDICLFAKFARKNFLNWKEWKKYNWKNNYKDSKFDVKVKLKIKMTGMIKQ